MSIAVASASGPAQDGARSGGRRRRRQPPRLAARGLARRQVRPRGGPHPPDRHPGARPPAARPAPRRPPPRAHDRHDDLRLPGLAARRPRQGARRATASCVEGHHVMHVPGLNEELGATVGVGQPARRPAARLEATTACSASGTARRPGSTAPPTRSATATSSASPRTGGALALVGDDPGCKSSTIPSASESLLASLHMPVFYPGNVQEVLDLGLHALACSRASGPVGRLQDRHERRRRARHRRRRARPRHAGDADRRVERQAVRARAERQPARAGVARHGAHAARPAHRARARVRARERRQPDRGRRRDAWLGIVAAGKPYYDLMQALRGLGLDGRGLERAGIRILKLGMLWPLEPRDRARVRARARRDPRGRGEGPVPRDARSRRRSTARPARRASSASATSTASRCCPRELDLDADLIARAVAARLEARGVQHRLGRARALAAARRDRTAARRSCRWRSARPFFCSGCPHNTLDRRRPTARSSAPASAATRWCCSTPRARARSPASRRWAARARSGSAWRRSPTTRHLVQNLGDGTFHHSGSLAIRAAVAAGVNITYKLLYNEHVAMTGGQDVEGQLSVPDLTRWLELEGVARIIVTTEDPSATAASSWPRSPRCATASELLAAQQELAAGRGRDRPDPRPGVRGRAAPPAQARQGRRARRSASGSTSASARAAATAAQKSELPVGAAGRDRVRPQDPDPPGLLQQGLLLPRGRLPVVPHGRARQAAPKHADARRSTSSCPSRAGSWPTPTSACG